MKNLHFTILPSAARTASPERVRVPNGNGQALHVILDITAVQGAPAVQLHIEGYDRTSEKYYPLLSGEVENSPGTRVYRVGPGLDAVENETENDFVPEEVRIRVQHTNGDSITYSVGASVIGASA